MSDTLPSPIGKNLYDDEISISDLLMKLWAKRGLIVFLPLVLAGLTVAGLLLTKANSSEKLSYYIELTGLKDSAYPNGTAFSPQDLLNPQVTAELGERFSATSARSIVSSVRVAYGSPLSEGVLTEYRAALSANSKASPEEIALINERYEQRVKDAASRGIRIEVDYGGLGLSQSQGSELAYALPQVWNEVFSRQFRIFLDTGIAGLPAIGGNVDLTTTFGALETELLLTRLIEGIGILKKDGRFRSLQAEGVSPGDLGHKVADFQRLYFNPIYARAFESEKESELSAIYRRDLLLEILEIEASLVELNDRITSIIELQRTDTSSNTGLSEINGGSSQVQIEGDALNQLVMLSRTASLAEYLQSSFDKRAELIERKASINTRLQKMGGDGDGDRLLSDDFIATAAEKLADIKRVYSALLVKAQETARAEVPSLYQVSTQVQVDKLLQRRDSLFIALALALGGMLAVIVALLWPRSAA